MLYVSAMISSESDEDPEEGESLLCWTVELVDGRACDDAEVESDLAFSLNSSGGKLFGRPSGRATTPSRYKPCLFIYLLTHPGRRYSMLIPLRTNKRTLVLETSFRTSWGTM